MTTSKPWVGERLAELAVLLAADLREQPTARPQQARRGRDHPSDEPEPVGAAVERAAGLVALHVRRKQPELGWSGRTARRQ